MAAQLTPAPLEAARAPLAQLTLRGWIWQGRQMLDGLLCLKARTGEAWPPGLLPWLGQAKELLESADHVLLRFEGSVAVDCAALGPLVPLRRQHGLLSSAHLAPPGPAAAALLQDHLILVLHGAPMALPLAGFRSLDIASLWDVSSAGRLDILTLPRPGSAPLHKALKPHAAVPFDPDDGSAGFSDLQRRLERPEPGFWRRLLARRRPPRPPVAAPAWLGRLLLFAAILGPLARCVLAPEPEAPLPDPLWLLLIAFAIGLGTLLLGRPSPEAPAAPAGTGQGGPLRRLARRLASLLPSPPGGARPAGWLGRLLLWLLGRTAEGAAPRQAAGTPAPAEPRRRGLLGRLAAWLVWRTPLRSGLQRRYARRLREVEELFRQGRIEEALKRALALARTQDAEGRRNRLSFGDMPLSGPEIRARLELNLSGVRARVAGAMPPDAYGYFLELYRAQAAALLAAGDVERAVFIHAELLDNPQDAVSLLVRHERFETAARLAQARRLPPGQFIPLWFRAGDKARALALAARHEAFPELWKELQPGDPFRAVLGEAWARRLAASGHDDLALAITDGLTGAIATERQAWMRRSLEGRPRGEAIARALKVLPWAADDRHGPYHAFLALLQAGPEAAAERIALAQALADPKCEADAEAAGFPDRLPLPAHHLARHLLADEALLGHDPARAAAAARLSQAGGQTALLTDLRRLKKLPRPHPAPAERAFALPASPLLAAIIDAVAVPGGRVLVAYRSGLLKLMDFAGRELWRVQINGLHGLVAIGQGHQVLVVRDDLGERMLSVVDTQRRQHRELGVFPVAFYHPWAGQDGWMVFSGRHVLCLDVPSLLEGEGLAGADGPVQHWAIPMSEPGSPLFLVEKPDDVNLAYLRQDGLVEWWWLDRRSLRIGCRYWIDPPQVGGGDLAAGIFSTAQSGEYADWWLWTAAAQPLRIDRRDASRAEELQMIKAVPKPPPRLLPIQPMASLAAIRWHAAAAPGGVLWSAWQPSPERRFSIAFTGAGNLHAHPHPQDPVTTVFDDLGRLLVIDVHEGRTLMRWPAGAGPLSAIPASL